MSLIRYFAAINRRIHNTSTSLHHALILTKTSCMDWPTSKPETLIVCVPRVLAVDLLPPKVWLNDLTRFFPLIPASGRFPSCCGVFCFPDSVPHDADG